MNGEDLELKDSTTKPTSIILITNNNLDYTKLCIESIRAFTKNVAYDLIVIDNNSADDTVEWLKSQNDLIVIQNSSKIGFAKACNQGINVSNGEEIVFLTSDIILTHNWLYNLKRALYSEPKIGAVGPYFNNCPYCHKIEYTYGDIKEMMAFAENHNESSAPNYKYQAKLSNVCCLIKKEVLHDIGLFDESYDSVCFLEDDISFNIICSGYKLLLCLDTFVHYFNSTAEEKKQLHQSELKNFKDKWKFDSTYSCNTRGGLLDLINEESTESFNVLDIGCGIGVSLLELKNIYPNVGIYGIEISEGAGFIAKSICDCIIGNIENIELPYDKGFFSYIILGDVLEHLTDPWKVISNLKKYIKEDGYIIASIPNIMHGQILYELIHGKFTYVDAGILDKTHLRFFTINEIKELFHSNGYKIESISSVKVELHEEYNLLIDKLCKAYNNENLREEYEAYQYIIKAKLD